MFSFLVEGFVLQQELAAIVALAVVDALPVAVHASIDHGGVTSAVVDAL